MKKKDFLEYYSRIIDEKRLLPNGKIKDTAFALCVMREDYLLISTGQSIPGTMPSLSLLSRTV